MFENASTNTKQGDIGEARAIYEYTRLGYGVSAPLFDSLKYDLIVEIEGELKKVQVKTTDYKAGGRPYFTAKLQTGGGNKNNTTTRNREDSDYDILFVMTSEGTCYSIPVSDINARAALSLSHKYDSFKL